MAKGQPAVELPGQDLLPQNPADGRTDRTQPYAYIEQLTGLKAKALTDPQRFGRGKHLHPPQEVGECRRRLA